MSKRFDAEIYIYEMFDELIFISIERGNTSHLNLLKALIQHITYNFLRQFILFILIFNIVVMKGNPKNLISFTDSLWCNILFNILVLEYLIFLFPFGYFVKFKNFQALIILWYYFLY